jgi:hypothetical protein
MPTMSRHDVLTILRKSGYSDLAERAADKLPDEIDLERDRTWLWDRYGTTVENLINSMGSP